MVPYRYSILSCLCGLGALPAYMFTADMLCLAKAAVWQPLCARAGCMTLACGLPRGNRCAHANFMLNKLLLYKLLSYKLLPTTMKAQLQAKPIKRGSAQTLFAHVPFSQACASLASSRVITLCRCWKDAPLWCALLHRIIRLVAHGRALRLPSSFDAVAVAFVACTVAGQGIVELLQDSRCLLCGRLGRVSWSRRVCSIQCSNGDLRTPQTQSQPQLQAGSLQCAYRAR